MNSYTPPTFLGSVRSAGTPVVLFGAGDIGIAAQYVLGELGIRVTCFADGRHSKQGSVVGGLEVRSPEQLGDLPQDTVIFLCGNYLTSMSARVRELGFRDIHDCVGLLDGFDFSDADLGMDPLFVRREIDLHKRETLKTRDRAEDTLILKYLDVVVTEACSMKCQDCSNLMQYYSKPKHSDLDLLERAVDQIMASIDGLYEFRVLGGEPFVNPKVHRVIDKLDTYGQVEKIIIYTNATIVPRGANLESLKNSKVVVYVTNYGVHSKKFDELIRTFDEHGISYLTKIPVWTDSGRIVHVERSVEELDDLFRNCSVNDILTLLNGKLYRCPFSANGTNLGAIPEDPADVVDLTSDEPVPRLREQLRRLYGRSTHLAACAFCNGRDYRTPRIEAALQTRRPLPLTVI
ncbi:4Fe-4S cluster-binding domain-containing protein [Streptomyces sp. NPDC001770]